MLEEKHDNLNADEIASEGNNANENIQNQSTEIQSEKTENDEPVGEILGKSMIAEEKADGDDSDATSPENFDSVNAAEVATESDLAPTEASQTSPENDEAEYSEESNTSVSDNDTSEKTEETSGSAEEKSATTEASETSPDNEEAEKLEESNTLVSDDDISENSEETIGIAEEDSATTEAISSEKSTENSSENAEENSDNIITLTPEQLANDAVEMEDDSAAGKISRANAEENEDESARNDNPIEEYENMSMEQQVAALEKLVEVEKVMSVKDHVEALRNSFMSKYNDMMDEKKEAFENENPDSTEPFDYNFPLKHDFDKLYNQYRDRKNKHFKSLQNNLQANLERRLAIVEELKNLIQPSESIKDSLKHFNGLRDQWKVAGAIPKDKYNHVWNNYHFHIENFYDYLHLDRDARDGDFKHNLEQKEKIIARVDELLVEPDVIKAFRELQDLHKIWKEDLGPVSREHREDVWNRFSELTRKMHDKREELSSQIREVETENLSKKEEVISKLNELAQHKVNSHGQWMQQIGKVEELRKTFFDLGKVPQEVNEQTWQKFKKATRDFNSLKNSFYKDLKKEQNDNLSKKQELVEKAKSMQDSEDFASTTQMMKQIQEEWKAIGHVPRKYSDKLWKEFRAACNHYFEKLKSSRSDEDAVEMQAYEKKKEQLESIKSLELTGNHKPDLDLIKAEIEKWKGYGRVPFSKRHVEAKFNKILDGLFEKLSLSKKDTEMMRFNNRIESLSENDEGRKLDNERVFLSRKMEEVQSEILQLENNIQFFSSGKSKKENPMILEVRKNIDKQKEELEMLKMKMSQIKKL